MDTVIILHFVLVSPSSGIGFLYRILQGDFESSNEYEKFSNWKSEEKLVSLTQRSSQLGLGGKSTLGSLSVEKILLQK